MLEEDYFIFEIKNEVKEDIKPGNALSNIILLFFLGIGNIRIKKGSEFILNLPTELQREAQGKDLTI